MSFPMGSFGPLFVFIENSSFSRMRWRSMRSVPKILYTLTVKRQVPQGVSSLRDFASRGLPLPKKGQPRVTFPQQHVGGPCRASCGCSHADDITLNLNGNSPPVNNKNLPRGGGFLGIYAFPRILYMPVPQTAHLPLRAFMPFFMVTSSVLTMSRCSLHFMHRP